MPRREKRRRSPVGRLHVLSQVPTHPRTAAKVRGFSRRASDFTAETDCLLEQAGFELMVPRVAGERCRKDKLPSRAMALVGARRGSMSAPFMAGP
jgi:hypothetical protein